MCETSSPEDADIIVQKLPSDMGIHRNPRKGTLNAPDKILDDFEFGRSVLVDEVFPDEFSLEETHNRIEQNTRDLVEYGRPLVSVGGDHSVSYPVLKALKENNPEMQLVWLDSHLDVKRPVESHVSHDVVVRRLVEENVFAPSDVYFVGITKIDDDEKDFLSEYDFSIYGPEEMAQFREEYDCSRPGYLSVDIDVLKQSEAPGTGYPDGQLSLKQAQKVVDEVNPVHADIVEVAPSLDDKGRTVEASRKIIRNIIDSF